MESGAVEIKNIAREAGVRSKIAVASSVPGVDPVGTFVGGHGTRVNAVMSEVGEQEKIDIIVWSDDTVGYITNALSPTRVTTVILDEANKKARVLVPEDQLSICHRQERSERPFGQQADRLRTRYRSRPRRSRR